MYMDFRLLISGVFVLALVGTGVYFFQTGNGMPGDNTDVVSTEQNTEPQNNEGGVIDPASWQQYENEEFDFTFKYPPQASTTVESQQVKVSYLGSGNVPNSEISNGFTLYIQSEATDLTVEEHAQAVFAAQSQPEYATVISPLEIVSPDANPPTYFFTVTSASGMPVSYLIFPKNDEEVFVVSHIISTQSKEAEVRYREIIGVILGTLVQKS